MRSLGNRLEAVLEIIRSNAPFAVFADVGSDHAHLAAAVKQSGLARRVIASDVNSGPLERGREYAAAAGIAAEFVLSDGFENIDPLSPDCAAVCGMGGELIADIISHSESAKKCLLVLQPMTAHDDLRKYLWDNGFEITGERFAVEGKKVYAVFSARYTGAKTEYSHSDLFLGKARPQCAEYAKYVEKALAQAKKRRMGEADPALTDLLIEECQTQIKNFSGSSS